MTWHKGRFLSQKGQPTDFVFFIPEPSNSTALIYDIVHRSLVSLVIETSSFSKENMKMSVIFENEPHRYYQISQNTAIPPDVAMWVFEDVTNKVFNKQSNILSAPAIMDDIGEGELVILEKLVSSPSSSDRHGNNDMEMSILEADSSFPDLFSGPVSFTQ